MIIRSNFSYLNELFIVGHQPDVDLCEFFPSLAFALCISVFFLVIFKDALDSNHDLLYAEPVVMEIDLKAAWFLTYNLRLFYAACYVILAASTNIAVSVIRIKSFRLLLKCKL